MAGTTGRTWIIPPRGNGSLFMADIIPVLTLPNSSGITTSSANGNVTTSRSGGNLYCVLTISATAPSAAQIKNAQNELGLAPLRSANKVVSAVGVNTFAFTGLSGTALLYLHFVHNAGGIDSGVVSSVGFQLQQASVLPSVLPMPAKQISRAAPYQVQYYANIHQYISDPQNQVTSVTLENASFGETYDPVFDRIVYPTDPGVDVVDSMNIRLHIASQAVSGVTSFQLRSPVGGTLLPFSVGQTFVQGDVPQNNYITSPLATFQADIRNRWPDGSAKFAVLSGRQTLPVNSPVTVTVQKTTTAPTGSNIAEPTPAALNTAASVVLTGAGAGTYTPQIAATNGLTAWTKATARKVREILGREMSEFHYYTPTPDTHLAIWWYVRVYADRMEIETVIENGWTYVSTNGNGATNKNYTAVVSVGGSTVFSGTVNQLHHTRASWVAWTVSNPQITPTHDVAYLRSTRMVPNYGFTSPTNATLAAAAVPNTVNPTPFTQGQWTSDWGSTGAQSGIALLPHWEALYCTSGDSRALVATIGNNRLGGNWPIHYRDENTGRPVLYNSYPNASFDSGWGSPDLGGLGTGGKFQAYEIPHSPSFGYLAYLIEGRWRQLEEQQFSAIYCLMNAIPQSRHPTAAYQGVVAAESSPLTTRGFAWALRSMYQAAAITPSYLNNVAVTGADAALRTALIRSVDDTSTWHKAVYVDGTLIPNIQPNGTSRQNTIGYIGIYGGDGEQQGAIWTSRTWMQDFQVMSIGMGWDLGIEGLNARSDFQALRDHAYTSVVQRMGTDATWNYRRGAVYNGPLFKDGSNQLVPHFMTVPEAFGIYRSLYGLSSLTSNNGDTLKDHESETNMAGGSSSDDASAGGYWAITLCALAYAVDHLKAGALAAWNKVTFAGTGYNPSAHGASQTPQFATVPRASVVAPTFYQTPFTLTENPISEGGIWLGGLADGLDWKRVQTIPGRAYAGEFQGGASEYNDPIAVLKSSYLSVTPNQFAEAVVYRTPGYLSTINHEVELLLRFSISAHNAHGYEVLWALWNPDPNLHPLVIVRWNGALADYTELARNNTPGIPNDGDVLRVEIIGNTITAYVNGVVKLSVADTTWTSGQPGMGFWPRPGATLNAYGFKSWKGGSL